jgi:hypothetical protein
MYNVFPAFFYNHKPHAKNSFIKHAWLKAANKRKVNETFELTANIHWKLQSTFVLQNFCKTALKRQSHDIFDLHFFHKSMAPRALINTLKYFQILFRFRAEISEIILTCIARSRIFGPFKVE